MSAPSMSRDEQLERLLAELQRWLGARKEASERISEIVDEVRELEGRS